MRRHIRDVKCATGVFLHPTFVCGCILHYGHLHTLPFLGGSQFIFSFHTLVCEPLASPPAHCRDTAIAARFHKERPLRETPLVNSGGHGGSNAQAGEMPISSSPTTMAATRPTPYTHGCKKNDERRPMGHVEELSGGAEGGSQQQSRDPQNTDSPRAFVQPELVCYVDRFEFENGFSYSSSEQFQ